MQYLVEIKQILAQARQKTYQAINTAMVLAYWQIGQRIVLEEQSGNERADYGKALIKTISQELTAEFGKGFSERNIRNFRHFYLVFSEVEKWQTVSAKLSWSHFQLVLKVNDENARQYYLTEAAQNMWSVRTLDRNISTLYYHRLLSSQLKEPVIREMEEKTKALQQDAFEFIKNPSVLEFLNLPNNLGYTEKALENALINNLKKFILELGKGFAFVERQQLIRTETSDFYIDLVFYNYILKCFVIIDLKTTKITHQDVGQLDMYVRMYNDVKKQETDNPTIGILLCTETDETIAKYSVLAENKQLFATKYLPYLPTEEELIAEIEREKAILNLENNFDEQR
ncbi:PDDEXK nuclease domain-containing protein [Pedobacter alpinus]|uniref:YhcG family protein n=1 Tax=Pedobacter alpinus TaxID=1590643 RepID=A0ABW5TXL7_9SPHI